MIADPSSTPTGGRALVWFRKDLRLADNPCLEAALRSGKEIIPVFIWNKEEGGAWSPGAAARWWLHQALASLGKDIGDLGGSLIFKKGKAEKILPQLAEDLEVDTLYFGRTYDPAGRATEQEVETAFTDRSVSLESFNTSLLQEPWEVKNGSGRPFQVFTPYWRKSRSGIYREPAEYSLTALSFSNLKSNEIGLEELELLPKHDWHLKLSEHWDVSEKAAHKLIQRTADVITQSYATARNIPSKDGTSRLSPYLAWGLVSPRQICQAVLAADNEGGHRGENKYLVEIGWREFSYQLLYHFPHIADQPLREKYSTFPWLDDQKSLHAWQFGNTGYPMVDAGMRQLYETGWMHNRVRMVVASFLVKHLLISWQDGARWFWDTLVDADLASNTQGWQWAAGCGADAAPYFRIFNPITQGEKFDGKGEYARKWIPSLKELPGKWIFKPWEAPPDLLLVSDVFLGNNYPHPCVDHKEGRARALEALASIKES
jgi:deoxyribodipyrimidine photo-lyase